MQRLLAFLWDAGVFVVGVVTFLTSSPDIVAGTVVDYTRGGMIGGGELED